MAILQSRPGTRDLRLDLFRGFALVTIFINHVPGNALEFLTSKNFGFSDAAEAFVYMSGLSAALAYSGAWTRDWMQGVVAIAKRVWRLYETHLMTTLIAVVLLGTSQLLFSTDALSQRVNFESFETLPLQTVAGVFILGHQLGYFNILPLYILLLAQVPLVFIVARRSLEAAITLSVLMWFLAGRYGINMPNYPQADGWFLNPFSWQLIFNLGLCTGLAAKSGRQIVEKKPWLMGVSIAYLLASLLVVKASLWPHVLFPDLPQVLVGFEKRILPLPRLLHFLALAYLCSHILMFSRLANWAPMRPFVLLGQHSLAVFASGSVLCILLQILREAELGSVALDSVFLPAGILIQLLIAWWLSQKKQSRDVAAPALLIGPVRQYPRHHR